MADDYEFSVDWVTGTAPVWRSMIASIKPRRVLEIGAYEGRSAVFMIENAAQHGPLELTCVDTWAGGVEHARVNMTNIEARFDRNIALAKTKHVNVTVTKIKAESSLAMARLIAEGQGGSFDVAYIDASHQAPDVLTDAVFAFKLLRIGGIMVFDDYLWHMEPAGQQDLLNMPKPAIDAFVNLHIRKLNIVAGAPLKQLYVAKASD
jgi:predicted O-methyltransferase YrrM